MDKFEKLPLKKLFIFSFVLAFLGILINLASQLILPPEIPLLYGLPQTEIQLVSPLWIITPQVVSIIITLINCLIALKISDTFLKKTLAVTSLFVSILGIITTFKIVFLVGFL